MGEQNDDILLPSQCRGARGLLKWTQPQLAEASGIGLSTINRYENETRPPRPEAVRRLRTTLESVGVQFIFEDASGGIGVRLMAPETSDLTAD